MPAPAIVLHIRNYASAGFIAALAGLFTFPILIKNLSVEDYGILGLITSTLTLFVAVGKLGVQHSILRFYAQVKEKNSQYSLLQLNSTSALLLFGLSVATFLSWLVSGYFIFPLFLNYQEVSVLFAAAACVVFILVMNSISVNYLRAQQRSGKVAIYQVLTRYVQLGFVLTLLFFGWLEPKEILWTFLITEIIGAVFLWHAFAPSFSFAQSAFSKQLAGVLLLYGLPLMVLESLGLILRASDRYIIESLLGTASLGQYSASYNLISYLELIIIAGVMQPIRPMYTALWESDGREATVNFLSNGFYLYLVLGLPVITVCSLGAPHLLGWLSSPEYEPGTIVMPFVAFSFYLEGAVMFLGAGLYLNRKTTPLMWWGLLATVLNISLNFIAVPRWGILGAAGVTVLSYIVFCVGIGSSAFRTLSFPLSLTSMFGNVAMCALTYWLVSQVPIESDFLAMIIKGAVATLVLSIGLIVFDVRVSAFVRGKFGPLMPRYVK